MKIKEKKRKQLKTTRRIKTFKKKNMNSSSSPHNSPKRTLSCCEAPVEKWVTSFSTAARTDSTSVFLSCASYTIGRVSSSVMPGPSPTAVPLSEHWFCENRKGRWEFRVGVLRDKICLVFSRGFGFHVDCPVIRVHFFKQRKQM